MSLVAPAPQLAAAPIPVVNPSFEADVIPTESGNTRTITGWMTSPGGGDGAFRPAVFSYPADAVPDGENVAFVNEPGNRAIQILSTVLENDTTYTLEVQAGRRLDTAYVGYLVQLRAGGVLLAEDDASLEPAPGTFVPVTVIYNSGAANPLAGQPLEIHLLSNGTQTNYDDVRLDGSATLAAATGIPTLAESGLLALVLLTACAGWWALRRGA